MPEYLTTKELADLLRVKERKVYELAAEGTVPCSKVTGKLLFPERAVRAWIDGEARGAAGPASRSAVFLGSHDPLLDWALREAGTGLATYFDGSQDGLDRFARGEGVATGLHLRGPDGAWNVPAVAAACAGQPVVLLGWASRSRGLIVRPEDRAAIRGAADLDGRRVVPRQAGSGAEVLFRALAEGVSPELTAPARTEADAALAVLEGRADAAFGLEALAAQFRLAFVPLVEERFDLAVDRRAYFELPIQRLMDFARSGAFRERAAALPGYRISRLGEVVWNAD